MPTPEDVLRAAVHRAIRQFHPAPASITAIYTAVESELTLDAADRRSTTLHSQPTGHPAWKRNLRNALKADKNACRLVNIQREYWQFPTPLPDTTALSPEKSWQTMLKVARQHMAAGLAFSSHDGKRTYQVTQSRPAGITVQDTTGNSRVLAAETARRCIRCVNAAGGRTGRSTLHLYIDLETAVVALHPQLHWSADGDWIEMQAHPRARWLEFIDALKPANQSGQFPYPYKALLLLLMLGRAQRGESNGLRYLDFEPLFSTLCDRLRQSTAAPWQPFWYLRGDGIWEIPDEASVERMKPLSRDRPKITSLRNENPTGQIPAEFWTVLCSNRELREETCSRLLERFWLPTQHDMLLDLIGMRLSDEEPEASSSPAPGHQEGTKRRMTVNVYERNRKARQECIDHYGAVCTVCDMSFKDRYSGLGEGFIHVHHLKPLSEIGTGYTVDPRKDLRPVCPNCHAVIHMRRRPYSIEEARKLLQVQAS